MSAESDARASAARLKAIMERWGVRCSVELQAGRNGAWIVPKYLRMHHHTATRPSQGATPALGIVKTGRPDVPGPLANGYGGNDLIFRIITMGLANHPGQGGPVTIDGVHVPKDSMRSPSFGVEWEGGYEAWTPRFLEFMGRADNALREWMRRPATSQLEHLTWAPARKIDRYKFSRTRGIALTGMWSGQAQEDEFMAALSEQQQKDIYDHIVGNGRLASIHRDTAGDGRLKEVTLNTRGLLARAPGYFAVTPESRDDGVVYYVDGAHQTKVAMEIGSPFHEWVKTLHRLIGANERALEKTEDELPETVGA